MTLDVFERLEGIKVMGSKRLSDFQYVVQQAREQGYQGDGRINFRLINKLSSQKSDWLKYENFNLGFTLTLRGALFENGNMPAKMMRGRDATTDLIVKFWNAMDKHAFGKANVEKRNMRFKRIGIKEAGVNNRNTHWHYVVDTGEIEAGLFMFRANGFWENYFRAGYIEWNDNIGENQKAWAQYSSKQITTVSSDVLCTHTTHLSDEIKWHTKN